MKTHPRSLVVVAIPVMRVSARVVLEKGRGWSAVDELVLWALAREPRSAGILAQEINLPRSVVLQVIFRMMRFRLVEVVLADNIPSFRATLYGVGIISGGDEIPSLRRRVSRKVAFVVDRMTGTVFAKRDVRIESSFGLRAFHDAGADVREIRVSGASLRANTVENVVRFQKVLAADETLVHFDGDTLVEREDEYMIVAVDGDDVRGMPPSAPVELARQVHRIARAKAGSWSSDVPYLIQPPREPTLPIMVQVEFDPNDDLIIGGEAHEGAFYRALGTARRRLILHSTFLKLERFEALAEALRNAARRGVRVDIFWGAGTPDEPGENAFTQAIAISQAIAADELLRQKVRIHLRSTGSHAKLLLADDGEEGWIAIVGSCNWLWSLFNRLEVSVRLRGSSAVAEVADRFCRLVARPGFRPEIGAELHMLAARLRMIVTQPSMYSAGVVTGIMHEAILRVASGGASERFVVASDRLGNAVFANAIVPAEVFAGRTGVVPIVVYGQTSGAVADPSTAAEIAQEAARRGVSLIAANEGFHAKFLLWGDDDIVVTSLNWGSATLSPDHSEGEIGVYLRGPSLASGLYDRMRDFWPLPASG